MHAAGRMTRWGVGPKFMMISIVIGLFLIFINHYYFPDFLLSFNQVRFWSGIALVLFGMGLFFVATFQVHRAFNDERLVTGGVYAYMRHPVYAVWILFIAPGLLLITGVLFLIVLPFIMYALMRMLIVEEDEYLERKFGQDFLDYKKRLTLSFLVNRKKLY